MSNFYNNRERSDRFQGNRSYIHQPGSVEWWRGAFALIAVAASLWMIWHFALSPAAKENGYHSSRGELTLKHSAWNDRCDACHKPSDCLSPEASEFWSVNSRWTEFTCKQCHASPQHHKYGREEDLSFDQNCGSCHHDHQGKNYSLVRISDTHCTRCHAELSEHPVAAPAGQALKPSIYADKITGFADMNSHPNFRALEEEKKAPHQRSIKFSHALHMSKGIVYAEKQTPWTIKDIQDRDKNFGYSYADRYATDGQHVTEFDSDGVIQLTCSACHELDSGRKSNKDWLGLDKIAPEAPKESLLLPRAEGAYYLPVNFEKHCQGCHPIAVSLNSNRGDSLSIKLPHRKQPAEFRDLLLEKFTAELLVKRGDLKDYPSSESLPARLDKPVFNLSKDEKDNLNKRTNEEINRLMTPLNEPIDQLIQRGKLAIESSGNLCSKCHFNEDTPTGEKRIKPASIPTVWFEHAKFSHVGHRAMKCAECHKNMEATFEAIPGDSLGFGKRLKWNDPEAGKFDPIGIVGIDLCQKCHSPAREEEGIKLGGVRHQCTDCHRYHNAEYPLQGLGAAARDPYLDQKKRMDTLNLMEGLAPEIKQKLNERK